MDCEPGERLALRLPPAPSSGDSTFQGDRGSCLHPELWDDEPPLGLGSSQLRWIKYLSGFEETKGERGKLTGQRDTGEFWAHAALEHSVIEVL